MFVENTVLVEIVFFLHFVAFFTKKTWIVFFCKFLVSYVFKKVSFWTLIKVEEVVFGGKIFFFKILFSIIHLKRINSCFFWNPQILWKKVIQSFTLILTADLRGPSRFLCFIKGSGLWLNRIGTWKERHFSAYFLIKKHNSWKKFLKS